mmetsp:Transcript_10325/g.26729  ORF Transcript_10325/g.26729 Transcript_10325/m.26729 type:complete len:183 (-) Transcript_10325:614-1162(-)
MYHPARSVQRGTMSARGDPCTTQRTQEFAVAARHQPGRVRPSPAAREPSLRAYLEMFGVPPSNPLAPEGDQLAGHALCSNNLGQGAGWPDWVAKVMIKNIPCRLGRRDVAEVLDGLGLSGMHSTIRVPTTRGGNKGYAFVQFLTPESARMCYTLCHGQAFGDGVTTKRCEVVPATLQGTWRF